MSAVSRLGDSLTTGHGCDSVTVLAMPLQSTVRANGILVSVIGTPTVSHLIGTPPLCFGHIAALNTGSSTGRINSIPIGRIGDSADGGVMISGSSNVFAG